MRAKPGFRRSERFGHESMLGEDQDLSPCYALSDNLSEAGMCLKSLFELHPGTHILIRIDDDELDRNQVPARVVWCKKVENSTLFHNRVGVEFFRSEKNFGLKASRPITPQMKTSNKKADGFVIQMEKRLSVVGRADHIGQEELEMETSANILVVDDNNVLQIVVCKMLCQLGYEVSSVENGEHGSSIFFKNKFAIVLSDYEMPEMDGVAFARPIKKRSPRKPVVIMTGAGKKIDFSRKSPAVDEVISKPFTLAEIDEALQNLSGEALCA